MSEAPEIAVVIAARNASATVGRSVASALRQDQVAEVIVVDDGSTDETAEAATAADDRTGRLRVLRLDSNRGPSAARNEALRHARSNLVCALDADDHLADSRFTKMLAGAEPDWDFLADDLLLASEGAPDAPTGRLIGVPDGRARRLGIGEFVSGNIADPRRPRRELGYLKPLMKRDFLVRFNLTYDESVRLGEDYVLYGQALLRGARFMLMAACGYVAVEHAGSLSHRHGAAELAALAAADARLIDEARHYAPEAVPIIEAHRRGVRLKLDHHLVLDARRRGDWLEVARRLLRTPATTAYILGQTLQAKAGPGRLRPDRLPSGRSV